MINVAIFGAGGHGREVLLLLQDMQALGQDIRCVAFVVDEPVEAPTSVHGIPVHRGLAGFVGQADVQFVVALGDPALRRRTVLAIERVMGPRFATVVHPRAWVGPAVEIGSGTVVMGLASITTDVSIGRHVVIHPQVSIAHDCLIEDFATLAPAVSLAGHVHAREGCNLGVSACVVPDVEVGRWSTVGAGAVVISAVPPNTTVVGVPARVIAERPPGWHAAGEPDR